MKFLGLTPWRIFLLLCAVFCATVASAWLGYHWAIVACHITGRVTLVVGVLALVAALVLSAWMNWQERKGGDVR